MSSDGLVTIDPVRRNVQAPTGPNLDDGKPLAQVEGWQILALLLDGTFTTEQCMAANSIRVRQCRTAERRAA